MSQTRLCRDRSRESERNASVYPKSKRQIPLTKGFMHKDAKSLSLKLASASLPKKEPWGALNGKAPQRPDADCLPKENHTSCGSNSISLSDQSECIVANPNKMSPPFKGSTLLEKSVHEKINFSLHLPLSNSTASSIDTCDPTCPVDDSCLKLIESGFPEEAEEDRNKTSLKKSKTKRKKHLSKSSVPLSAPHNNDGDDDDDDSNEDVNGNPLSLTPIAGHPDVSQSDPQPNEMGKELAYKQSLKPNDSPHEGSTVKGRKSRREEHFILAENIPGFRGGDNIEDILKFIGKNQSRETFNKSLERKKKAKRKSLGSHVFRSGICSTDAKSELSDTESTTHCPSKSPPSFLEKELCSCDTSEVDSCHDEDNSCVTDNRFVSSPGSSAPSSAEPFILVEKKNKKKLNPTGCASASNPNNSKANKYLSSKSTFRNRKLNSAMAHGHAPHQQFTSEDKADLDASFPELESSYHTIRRNSTGNVVMSVSTIQSIPLEDSDNESWKSLPISQGVHLTNEKSYPVSYAKIAASTLPVNPNLLMGNPSIVSANDDGGGGGGSCSSGSVTSSSDGISRQTIAGNDLAVDSLRCKMAAGTRSDRGGKNKYFLQDDDKSCNAACVNRRHSIGECVGSPEAAIEGVLDSKQEISRSQNLRSSAEPAINTDLTAACQISFGDHRSEISVDELLVSKCSLKDKDNSPSSSIETLTPHTLDAEKQSPGDCLNNVVPSSTSVSRRQFNGSSNSSQSGTTPDEALAVKFINPRDRRHNIKQFKITFGFFCDNEERNTTQSANGSREETTGTPNVSLSSSTSPPVPSACPVMKRQEMDALHPLGPGLGQEDTHGDVATPTKNLEGGQSDSLSPNANFMTKAPASSKTSTFSSSSSSSSPPLSCGAPSVDLVHKDKKSPNMDTKSSGGRLNGLVHSLTSPKTCVVTPSSNTTPTTPSSGQAVIQTTTPAITRPTTNSTPQKSLISISPVPSKTHGNAASTNAVTGAPHPLHSIEKLVSSGNSATARTITAGTTTTTHTTNSTSVNNNSNKNNNNNTNSNNLTASATVDKKVGPNVLLGELGLIPLIYGTKIRADEKKIIHFRNDEADAQFFNQAEVLSYLSKEYHRVCQLSGPSTIVQVGTD